MSLTYADAHGDLIETLDADLRAVVRAEGVDPQRDAPVVRRLASRVVGDHDQRSLTGAVLPVTDHDAVVEELVARVSGFGALQRYLDDAAVEEIWINDPSLTFPLVRGSLSVRSPHRVRSSRKSVCGELPGGGPRPILGGRPQVRVGVQRDGRRLVSQCPLDGHHVASGGDEAGGVEVSQ